MSESSGFFTSKLDSSGKHDRMYVAEQFAEYFARFISNGVFMNLSSSALLVQALPNEGMKIVVNKGDSFINGFWYSNDSGLKKNISPADGVLKRIDLVVIRYSTESRETKCVILEGTPSNSPVEPAYVRNADYYDLVLAKINIPAGATKIQSSYITDLRLDNTYCGSVGALVEQIDTTSYGSQLNSFIANYIETSNETYETFESLLTDLKNSYDELCRRFQEESEDEFNTWFESIKGKLGTDPAASLQTQIDAMHYPILPTDTILEWALTARSGDTVCVPIGTATDGVSGAVEQYVQVYVEQNASRRVLLKLANVACSGTHQRVIVNGAWAEANWQRGITYRSETQAVSGRVTTIENRTTEVENRTTEVENRTTEVENRTTAIEGTLNTLGVVAKGTLKTEGMYAVPYILFTKTLSAGVYTFSYYGRVNTEGDEPALIGSISLSKPIAGQIGGSGEILSRAGLQRDSADCINITFTICLEEETNVSCKVALNHRPPLYESIWSLVKVC